MKPYLLVLMTMCVLMTADTWADDLKLEFQKVTSEAGRFTAEMPGKPQTRDEQAGPVRSHSFVAPAADGSSYLIGYYDFPAESVQGKAPQDLLKVLSQAFLSEGEKIVATKEVAIEKTPGLDYQVVLPKGESFRRERMYWAEGRLYRLIVVGSKDAIASKDAERFFGSFSLTAPSPTFQKLTSELGRFTVEMPQGAELHTRKMSSGQVYYQATSRLDEGPAFAVYALDLPELEKNLKFPQGGMQAFRQGAWQDAKIVKDQEIVLPESKTPGREFVVESDSNYTRERMYLHQYRLYRLLVTGSKEAINSPTANRFLDSLSIRKQ